MATRREHGSGQHPAHISDLLAVPAVHAAALSL
jgi:hypothetical protein